MKGDPIRFEEPIWGRKSPRHQDEIVGRRIVTAQVMDEEGEWLWIEIKEVGENGCGAGRRQEALSLILWVTADNIGYRN